MTVTQLPQQDRMGMLTDMMATITGGARGIGAAIGRRPDEIARVVCFLAADQSAYITGQIWAVNGGLDM